MKTTVNLNALKINGHDPRLSQSFLLLSSELSQLNGALPGKLDWPSLEEQCFQLFREYGYDLQSGVWFCLINLRLKSWKGLALALDLLSTALTKNSQRCWPPVTAVPQRQYIVDWFSANVATHIYTLAYGPENAADLQRVEQSIHVLCEQSKNLQARSKDSLNNLHYFLQVRCRSVPYPHKPQLEKRTPTPVADVANSSNIKKEAEPTKVAAPQPAQVPALRLEPVVKPRPVLWALGGMAAGMTLTVVVVSLWFYAEAPALSERVIAPLASLQEVENHLDTAWLRAPKVDIQSQQEAILQQAAPVLTWIGAQSPDALLRLGSQLSSQLENTFPGNKVSADWQRGLKEKSESISTLEGFINANRHLDELDARLLHAEQTRSKYLTVSELKTAVNQIRQDLMNGGAPTETLLYEIQQQQANKRRVNPALMESVSRRLESLISTYEQVNQR